MATTRTIEQKLQPLTKPSTLTIQCEDKRGFIQLEETKFTPKHKMLCADITKDEKHVVAGCADGKLRVFDRATGEVTAEFKEGILRMEEAKLVLLQNKIFLYGRQDGPTPREKCSTLSFEYTLSRMEFSALKFKHMEMLYPNYLVGQTFADKNRISIYDAALKKICSIKEDGLLKWTIAGDNKIATFAVTKDQQHIKIKSYFFNSKKSKLGLREKIPFKVEKGDHNRRIENIKWCNQNEIAFTVYEDIDQIPKQYDKQISAYKTGIVDTYSGRILDARADTKAVVQLPQERAYGDYFLIYPADVNPADPNPPKMMLLDKRIPLTYKLEQPSFDFSDAVIKHESTLMHFDKTNNTLRFFKNANVVRPTLTASRSYTQVIPLSLQQKRESAEELLIEDDQQEEESLMSSVRTSRR